MNILILGAGQVGSAVAASLISENTNITVVDQQAERLQQLEEQLDLRTLLGDAAHPSVLREAGAEDTDMLLAVTYSDQVNLVACKLAATLFHIPLKIARIRSAEYLEHRALLAAENFSVDYAICPEQVVTEYVAKLIEYPEALQVVDFANGALQLVAVRALRGSPLVGQELRHLHRHLPAADARVVAIFREGLSVMPGGATVIESADEVFFIAPRHHIASILQTLREKDRPVRKIMIAGGGNIGSRLARQLQHRYRVKLIERKRTVTKRIASELPETLVLAGDVTDERLLEAEDIEEVDMYCALTNDDEDNIMSALLAKRMGARKVLALINRAAYVDLMQGDQLDIALSPAQVTIGGLLAHVRRGDVVAVHSLRRGAAEALEIVAHGDIRWSSVVGRHIQDIDLPSGVTIGAIARGLPTNHPGDAKSASVPPNANVMLARPDTLIESADRVILFVTDKSVIPKVEKLFQVGVGYL